MNNNNTSFGDGIIAAFKVGTANAVSVVMNPIHTAQVILGLKEEKAVSDMIREEIVRRKVKHSSTV